ncbi:MAG: ribosomal protein S18-alanine N-acetyltransferase [candidate division Zixibacteria bacterium]|nr:ribosomal protein S18-alanine N-acetyltransferase [candidate division Zixibacteria bacterium]
MKGDFEISEMTSGDLGQVCRIENEVFPNPWPKSAFEGDISNDATYCPVVKDSSGNIIGYASLTVDINEAHLTNIAVSTEYRRQGIGSILMDDVISKAEREGCRAIFLEVRNSNLDARGFYTRYDFTELYRHEHYYRKPTEDALVLVRPIGERNSHG